MMAFRADAFFVERCDMTVAEFLDVFDTDNATVAVKRESESKEEDVITFKNSEGVSDQLAEDLALSVIKSVDITGSTSVSIVLEALLEP